MKGLKVGTFLLSLCTVFLLQGHDFFPRDGKQMNQSMTYEGKQRSYVLYRPKSYRHQSLIPLVMVMHGGGGTARGMLKLTQKRFNELADDAGFLVVYPQGEGRHWNDGRTESLSSEHRSDIDDVGFLTALLQKLKYEYPVDPDRVFATGISDGGLMVYRLACEVPHEIRAIAPVNATLPLALEPVCEGASGVGLMVMNGTEDPLHPYGGGMISSLRTERSRVLSTGETISVWLENNECPQHYEKIMHPNLSLEDGTTVTSFTYGECLSNAVVELYRIEGGGHTWPGGKQYRSEKHIGKTSRDISACDEIWKFFSQF